MATQGRFWQRFLKNRYTWSSHRPPIDWGLRDYGKGTECIFGGDEGCEHEWGGDFSPSTKVGKQGMTEEGTSLKVCAECGAPSPGRRPTCPCNGETKPAVVLDPFCGTATVAQKCIEHHRDYVMIDIDPKSVELAERRTAAVQMRLV